MTNEFIVIGEHRENELELLVKGADGAYYDYNLEQQNLSPIQLDDDWLITEQADVDVLENVPAAKLSDGAV